MIQYAPIQDIQVTEEFYEDYDVAPKRIRKKINSLADQTLEGGRMPNSMNPHQSFVDEMWIGYVNRGGQHWRLLFWHDESENTLIFHRLLTHNEMDNYIGKNVRS